MDFKTNKAGFSLIEVIIAMLVMAIGLVGMLGVSSLAIRAANDNDKWTTARLIAQSRIERLTAGVHADLAAAAQAGTVGSEAETIEGVQYDIIWNYDSTGASASDPVAVTVFVTYPHAITGVTLQTVKSFFL